MQVVEFLYAMFETAADVNTKQWFENYLKGTIPYRGLKNPMVLQILQRWYQDHQIQNYSIDKQLEIVSQLIHGYHAEDILAGIYYIQKYLLDKVSTKKLTNLADIFFQEGCFREWCSTDYFCLKVLSYLVCSGQHKAIAEWRYKEDFWQRRASIVAFIHASANPAYCDLIEEIIRDLVIDSSRFIQTGIGWVIATLSRHNPEKAEKIVDKYLNFLSKEVITRHTKYLQKYVQYKQNKQLK